ncbi:MAG: SRPBCC domain-containing protein [Candidatus Sericytochromatia bacterium]
MSASSPFQIRETLHKPIAEVYQALTDPAQLSRYFAQSAHGEAQVGHEMVWKLGDYETLTFRVEQAEPPHRLALSWQAGELDYPLQLVFELVEQNGITTLSITETGWQHDAFSQHSSYKHCQAWQRLALSLKAWLQHGIDLR